MGCLLQLRCHGRAMTRPPRKGYAGRGLSQSRNAVAVACKQNAILLQFAWRAHGHQCKHTQTPASQCAHFFLSSLASFLHTFAGNVLGVKALCAARSAGPWPGRGHARPGTAREACPEILRVLGARQRRVADFSQVLAACPCGIFTKPRRLSRHFPPAPRVVFPKAGGPPVAPIRTFSVQS